MVKICTFSIFWRDHFALWDSNEPYLWWRYNWECVHDSVGVFLSDFGDQESSHTRTGTTTEGVGQLESLETVTALSLLSDNIENRVDEFSALCVVTLGPVVSSSALSEHKVVWTEDLSEWSGSYWVHGSRLEINKDSPGDIFASCIMQKNVSTYV